MAELWKALLAVIGAAIGAVVTYAFWRRQQRALGLEKRLAGRAEAYRTMWTCLQEAEVKIRAMGKPSASAFGEVAREVNLTCMKLELLLGPDDRQLVADYLEAVRAAGKAVTEVGDENAKESWTNTGAMRGGNAVREMSNAMARMRTARETFRSRAEAAAGGPLADVD
jgi:hypothetical protein